VRQGKSNHIPSAIASIYAVYRVVAIFWSCFCDLEIVPPEFREEPLKSREATRAPDRAVIA